MDLDNLNSVIVLRLQANFRAVKSDSKEIISLRQSQSMTLRGILLFYQQITF